MKVILPLIMCSFLLSGCYKCTYGYSSACGSTPNKNEQYKKEYEEKLEKQKEQKNSK